MAVRIDEARHDDKTGRVDDSGVGRVIKAATSAIFDPSISTSPTPWLPTRSSIDNTVLPLMRTFRPCAPTPSGMEDAAAPCAASRSTGAARRTPGRGQAQTRARLDFRRGELANLAHGPFLPGSAPP
jgi:hypothetical protein